MVGKDNDDNNIKVHQVEDRPDCLPGWMYKAECGCGNLYIGITEKDGKPFEIFVSFGKSGRCANVLLGAVMVLSSRALRAGMPIEQIIKTLFGLKCDNPIPAMENSGKPILSCADAVAKTLIYYMEHRPSQTYSIVNMEKEFFEIINYAEKALKKIQEGDVEQAYYLNGVIFGKWMTLGRETWDKHMAEYNKITGEITKQLLEHKKKGPSIKPTPIDVSIPQLPVKEPAQPIQVFVEKNIPLIPSPPPVELKTDPTILPHQIGGSGIIGGKTCKECGGGPIIKKEGCEVCVACGDVKCGGG